VRSGTSEEVLSSELEAVKKGGMGEAHRECSMTNGEWSESEEVARLKAEVFGTSNPDL
jgi:hypothetical protein